MWNPKRRVHGGPSPSTCGICGKLAIYNRQGQGRCSPHRDVLTGREQTVARQMATRAAAARRAAWARWAWIEKQRARARQAP